MANERLRAAILERGMTPAALAEALGVDPKTVERWITQNRPPYRRHRYAAAAALGIDESFLWPDALSPDQVAAASESEIITVYPHRWVVPQEAWRRLFESAEHDIGVLVYAGIFLAEDARILRLFAEKATQGVRVRILLGDPDSDAIAQREADEDVPGMLAARIRNVIALYKRVRDTPGLEFRLHGTVLYNSIYRGDDQLLVNTQIYARAAADAPVLHLRKVAGGDMVTTYLESFDKVWDAATPLQ